MNKVKAIVFITLCASVGAGFAMTSEDVQLLIQEREKNNKSVSRKVAETGLEYAVAGTVLHGAGHVLHKISGAPEYKFTKMIFNPAFNTLEEYPKYYYNSSMFKHYSSRIAQGLLTASSVVQSPLRSVVASVGMPIVFARDYIISSHALKNPTCDMPSYYRNELHYIKTQGLKEVAKAPRAAVVGFAPVALYTMYKNRQQEQQND